MTKPGRDIDAFEGFLRRLIEETDRLQPLLARTAWPKFQTWCDDLNGLCIRGDRLLIEQHVDLLFEIVGRSPAKSIVRSLWRDAGLGGGGIPLTRLKSRSKRGVITLESNPIDEQVRSFHFLLEGKDVHRNRVKFGADVDLVFNYDVAPEDALAELAGRKLGTLLSEKTANLGITVIPRGFVVQDGNWLKTANFVDGNLTEPVRFKLKADDKPQDNAGVHIVFDYVGSILYEFDLPITLVPFIDPTSDGSTLPKLELNLDDVVVADHLPRTVSLTLTANGDQLQYSFLDYRTYEALQGTLKKLTRSSLGDRVGKIRNTLHSVTDHAIWSIAADHIDAPTSGEQKAFQECLNLTVEAGSSLYEDLASDEDFGELLKRINALDANSRVTIFTDCAFLPWEILYPRTYQNDWTQEIKDSNPIQVQEIWGYRFIMECLLMQKGATYKAPLQAHKSADVYVSYNLNRTIDDAFVSSSFKPVEAQKKWADISRSVVKVDLQAMGEDIKKVLQTRDYAATFIYLYCHGSNDQPFLDSQIEKLELDKDVTIRPDFLKDGRTFANGPIVFLNSCSSGAFSPLSFANFLSRFRDKHAIGLISTTFPVPATFAATFGHDIIESYIKDRKTIGDALLKLRRQLLKQQNPLGLFYALQCPMDTTPSQRRPS